MFMQMMMFSQHPIAMMVNNQEEERAIQRAIEESRRGGNSNDPDNMTYEQLLDLGERVGKVSKGLSKD